MTQSNTRTRLAPVDRKEQLLAVALTEARKIGYSRVTLQIVAQAASCAPSTVSHYFGTMTQLRRAMMRAAIKREVLEVIAQGLVDRNPQALAAPESLRASALQTLSA
jgi:AcrR family transcriptional regulator